MSIFKITIEGIKKRVERLDNRAVRHFGGEFDAAPARHLSPLQRHPAQGILHQARLTQPGFAFHKGQPRRTLRRALPGSQQGGVLLSAPDEREQLTAISQRGISGGQGAFPGEDAVIQLVGFKQG